MFCPNCGNQLLDNAKFCDMCGFAVPQRITPPVSAPVTPEPPKAEPQAFVPQPEAYEAPPVQAYQAPPAWQPVPEPHAWQSAPQPEPQSWQPAPEPQSELQAWQTVPQPQAWQAQPEPQPVPPVTTSPEKAAESVSAIPRDGRGKYILKRLIFCVIAIGVGILAAVLFADALPLPNTRGKGVPPLELFPRAWMTLTLIVIPLVISFAFTMLAGLAKNNGGKNAVRIISAVLRSLTPIALALVLIDLLGFQAQLLPIAFGKDSASWIMPILTLTLPLTGFLMNAAVQNGHESTFGKSVGAAAHWAADRMPIIVVSVIVIEALFSGNGIGNYLIRSIQQYNLRVASAILLFLAVVVYVLKFLMDVIAALLSGGDPAEQVYATHAKDDHSGKALFLIGVIFAGLVLLFAVIMPFIAGSPAKISAKDIYLAPGVKGHILGTDQFGRDVFAVSFHGLRNTVLLALTNTAIACVLGIGFGVLAGILPNGVCEIFKGLRYVLGFGAPLALFLLFLIAKGNGGTAVFYVIGLFTWGGIAERIGYGIKARKAAAPVKTALILPALEQLVHTFCAAVIGTSLIGFLGLMTSTVNFQTLGMLISSGRQSIGKYAYAGLTPSVLLIVLLLAFCLLHAGLSALERHLKAEAK